MKKTWFLGLSVLLLTIAAVGFTFNLQKKIILKEAESHLHNLATSVEMDIERAFFGLSQVFLGLENYLAAEAADGLVDGPGTRRILDKILQENDMLIALTVADGSGQILHWNNIDQKPNISERDYFRAHTSGNVTGLYIGNPQQSIINQGQFIFGISRAFRNESGELDHVISAIIDVKKFYRRYEKIFSEANTELTIFSEQGLIYTRIPGQAEFAGQQDPHFKKKIALVQNATMDYYHSQPDGGIHIAIIHRVGAYPLYISVVKESTFIFADWKATTWAYLSFGGGICLLTLLMTAWTISSQRKQLEINRMLQEQAITDSLTKLFNRRYILKQAELEMKKFQRSNLPLSFIMLDLDHFKRVNDNCGHAIGDQVLKKTAELLLQTCRDTDLISRFGGEEFLLLLPGTDSEGASQIAEKIRQTLEEQRFEGPKGEFRVTGSLGVCQFNGEEELSAALQRTDAALYNAKDTGRNRVEKATSGHASDNRQDHFFWLNKQKH